MTAPTTKTHWRSEADLANTPEFRAAAAAEFPGFENVFESAGEAVPADDRDPATAALHRRQFFALSAAALGLAGVAGCRRPDLEILPFASVPEEQWQNQVPGKPTFYATSFPRAGGAFPVLVESHDGRPTKVEGNPRHPASGGATDVHAQAAVLDLYSPDRVMNDKYPGVMERGQSRRWEDFDAAIATLVKANGEGFYVLAGQAPSPALRMVRDHMKAKLPQASWHGYEAIDTANALEGAKIAFGSPLCVEYDFAKADRVLALDCDFLGGGPEQVRNSQAFIARRTADTPDDRARMNRLYVVESTYTVTGTMADHRLRLPASRIGDFLVAVAKELKVPAAEGLKAPADLPEKWVKAVAKDLREGGRALATIGDLDHRYGTNIVIVGPRQPAWVHALAHALNLHRDGTSTGVTFREPPAEVVADKPLAGLVADMNAGKVHTLLVVGGNPAFDAPADLGFKAALQKVTHKVRLGLFFDQTSEACDWHLPLAHDLEGWGDTEASDGTLCCVQPLIAPLNGNRPATADPASPPPRGGRTALEVLALMTQFAVPGVPNVKGRDAQGNTTFSNPETTSYLIAKQKAYDTVRASFAARAKIAVTDKGFDARFNAYKQLGFLPGSERPLKSVTLNSAAVTAALAKYTPAAVPTKDAVEVTFHPDYRVGDGRGSMNPWLLELPDPITKLVWDNAASVSPATAAAFKLKQGDRVKLTVAGRAVEVPVYVLPGQADFSVALPVGFPGEMRISRVPEGGGFDVYPARTTAALHTAAGCKLEPTGKTFDLVTTQEHGTIPEGRDIVREEVATAGHAGHAASAEQIAAAHGAGQKDQPGHSRELTVLTSPAEHGHANPLKVGFPPDGHVTEGDLKKEFQGGYGNPQVTDAQRNNAREKQERFPLDLARPAELDAQFQWGMVIDLNSCTGCSACLIACQMENNIPVVGKAEVKRNREMHWIRIDRYFTGTGGTEEPTIVTQPVACVHCEAAPCESVCPVNAALHSPEGLNLQVYNRCIGTRYCANACPYKVRRFNWFDFNKRGLDELRVPTPFARDGMNFRGTGVPETLKMSKNPDVTVRMRGVMEKCTYCVQRLEAGKYGAKIAATQVAQGRKAAATDETFRHAGPASAYRKPKDPKAAGYDLDARGRVVVPDGVIQTACQEACPTRAITFGNTLDPASKVFAAKKAAGDYLLLGELNTKPRTSYRPRVRNPNPELMG